jgi:ACS family glucarate transporter-like MFS transporter
MLSMSESPTQPTAPTRVRWLIFALASCASWLLYLHRYAWGLVKSDFSRENPAYSLVDLGWLDSAFLITYAIGQIPGGLAADRFGPRIVLSVLALLWSPASAGVAWTTGLCRLIGARAIFGLAQAGVYPVLNKMTRTWFPLASRTSVQGVVTAMGRIGGACAPVLLVYFLMGRLDLSWQTALTIISVPGMALGVAFWLCVRDSPRQHPLANRAEAELIEAGTPPPSIRKRPPLLLTPASAFSLAMIFVYIFTSTFQDQFYVNWLPKFLKDDKGFDNETMGLFAPLPLVGGAIGGILGGILNDVLIRHWGNRRWARSVVAFTGKAMAAILVLASLAADDGRLIMLTLVAARVFSDWSLPTQWAAVTDMGGRAAGTLFGIVNTVGIAGGVCAGPVFGYVIEQYGSAGLFYGVATMCAIAAASWLFIDCTQRLVGD